MDLFIEVAVTENATSTERGRLLEKLGSKILNAMQYSVLEEIRITGMEVDLSAKHNINNEEIFVECKAYRDNISADVITKLLGNVFIKSNISSGWLLTTGPLGKDAKGLMKEWEEKPFEIRRKLQIYTPDRLIALLISSGRICPVDAVKKSSNSRFTENAYLLVTDNGLFWAVTLLNVQVGVPYAVMLFDATDGEPIQNQDLVDYVSKLDSSLKDLEWLVETSNVVPNLIVSLNEEYQNIVNVSGGDQWTDYRPSRPQDFVGRKDLQSEVFRFLDNVREGFTRTRLLALKAPSGWGKSSVLLKLVDRSKNKYHRGKYFVYAVDVRAATSQRYSEFSLLACLKAAVESGFIKEPGEPITISNKNNPLSEHSVIEILENLRAEGKVVVLFFDQFEEIFSKKELLALFESVRSLSMVIDGAQENIVLGFAWKTDGTIPADHPAYYMWHSLSDRRYELTLTQFTTEDISRALAIFSREIGSPLNPILKRHLLDHCQGYPWLLKKLCIHVYSLIRNGIDQVEILGRGLRIEELFEKDLSELVPAEISCVKKIAAESPADFFKTVELIGGDTVQSLINRRLVLRRGDRLILYWDIFRDYVLTGSVPNIPITYIPQTYFPKYYDSLRALLISPDRTLTGMAKILRIGVDAAENISRDLVMVGNGERQGEKISILQESEIEAIKKVMDFMNNHVLFKYLISESGIGFSLTYSEFYSLFREVYATAPYSEKTFITYANRMIGWLKGIGLIETKSNRIIHTGSNKINISRGSNGKTRTRAYNFLGDAPPERVIRLCELITEGNNYEEHLKSLGFRNAINVMITLDGLYSDNGILKLMYQVESIQEWLVERVLLTDSIILVIEYLAANPNTSVTDIGDYIAQKTGKNWTDASKIRNGGALLRWYNWIQQQQLVIDI